MIDPVLQWAVTALLAFLGALPTILSGLANWRKQRAELKKAAKEAPLDEMERGIRVAHQAFEDVITKSTRITTLETRIDDLKSMVDTLKDEKDNLQDVVDELKKENVRLDKRIEVLEMDKSRLETENAAQLQRIAALEEENRKKDEQILKMQARISKLEGILKENNIPFPTNGNTG